MCNQSHRTARAYGKEFGTTVNVDILAKICVRQADLGREANPLRTNDVSGTSQRLQQLLFHFDSLLLESLPACNNILVNQSVANDSVFRRPTETNSLERPCTVFCDSTSSSGRQGTEFSVDSWLKTRSSASSICRMMLCD